MVLYYVACIIVSWWRFLNGLVDRLTITIHDSTSPCGGLATVLLSSIRLWHFDLLYSGVLSIFGEVIFHPRLRPLSLGGSAKYIIFEIYQTGATRVITSSLALSSGLFLVSIQALGFELDWT